MDGILSGTKIFNDNLSSWDVSSITYIYGMFQGATAFRITNLLRWNVSYVTDMTTMFSDVTVIYADVLPSSAFNGDLSSWDVSSVMDMSGMFLGATSFNSNLSS